MTNLDNILKSRDISLPTKVCLVKAMVFPVVMYGRPLTASCVHGHASSRASYKRAVQYLSLCDRLLSLRRDLQAHLCCSRCPDALPFKGGIRSRCVCGPHSVYHPPSVDAGASAFYQV